MEQKTIIDGQISAPINWLKELEVVFDLTHEGGTTKVWLSGSMADSLGIREGARARIRGQMLGNMLKGECATFYPISSRFNRFASYRKLTDVKKKRK